MHAEIDIRSSMSPSVLEIVHLPPASRILLVPLVTSYLRVFLVLTLCQRHLGVIVSSRWSTLSLTFYMYGAGSLSPPLSSQKKIPDGVDGEGLRRTGQKRAGIAGFWPFLGFSLYTRLLSPTPFGGGGVTKGLVKVSKASISDTNLSANAISSPELHFLSFLSMAFLSPASSATSVTLLYTRLPRSSPEYPG